MHGGHEPRSRRLWSDTALDPFYDVLLARPDLDLAQPGLDSRPVLTNLGLWHEHRADLVARCEALVAARTEHPDTVG